VSIQNYVQLDAPDPLQATDLATKNYVDGQLSRSGVILHESSKQLTTGWGNTAITTYVVSGNFGTIPFTKYFAGTTLRVNGGCSGYVTGAIGAATWAVSPTNSSSDLIQWGIAYYNAVSNHVGFTWLVDITGRAAGNYSFSFWVKSSATTTSCVSDGNDTLWARVYEVWP
jgi:hypothetical protein